MGLALMNSSLLIIVRCYHISLASLIIVRIPLANHCKCTSWRFSLASDGFIPIKHVFNFNRMFDLFSWLLQSLRMQLLTSQCVASRKVIIHSRVPSSEFMVVEHRASRFFSVGQAFDQCIRVMGRKLAIRIPLHAENTFFGSADH